jgi:anti-sigma-K factor RskA
LRDAIAQAERAAELARLLDAAQAELAAAQESTEEARVLAEQLSEIEERLAAEQATSDKLRRERSGSSPR